MPPQTDCIQPVKGSSPSPSIGFKVFLHNRSMPASSCSRLDHSRVSLIRSLPLLVDVSLCPLSPDITSTSPVSHNPRLLAVEPFRSVTHPASPSTVYLPFPAFHLSLDLTLSPSSRSTKGDCLQSISRNREISISSYATELHSRIYGSPLRPVPTSRAPTCMLCISLAQYCASPLRSCCIRCPFTRGCLWLEFNCNMETDR